MESRTSSYLIPTAAGIFSSNSLRTKKPHFFPVSAALTKNRSKDSNPSTTTPQKATPTVCNDTRIVTKARPIVAPAAAFVLSLQATFSHALKYLIDKFIGQRISFSFDHEPRNVLPGNFAPVDELPPTRCPAIHGSIPPCLAGGAYVRNGPNPQFLQHGHHHMYDGDGMLHSLLFSEDGDVKLCSRYVKTYSYRLEHDHGDIMMPKFFFGLNGLPGVASRIVLMARILAGQIDPRQGIGMANTSVAIIGGCLYALGEPDLPYSVHVDPVTGEISTIGRCDFEGQLAIGMTAHPKKDPVTGEVFAFRYMPVRPYLTYFHFDQAGNKSADVPIISLQTPTFIHDFAITESYVLFNDFQLEMKLMDTILGSGPPVIFNKGKVSRLGVLPRYATDDSNIRWFDVPGFNMTHSINAWEEESENGENSLVLVATNMLNIEHMLEKLELVHSNVEMVRINLSTGFVLRKPLSVGNLELGVIHPDYVGRRNRYAYLGHGNPLPKISGVAKLDFSLAGTKDCVIASHDFGPGCLGGEPFFVPKDGVEEEDDGYLLSYVHNEDTGESRFVVMDARSPELDIVAEVVLPQRVPYGFHGLFISKTELLSQRQPCS